MRSRTRVTALTVALAIIGAAVAGCGGPPARTSFTPDVRLPRVPQLPEGQGAVVGVVADSMLGTPVVGASVYFTTSPLDDSDPPPMREGLPTGSTDARGGFVLAPVPPGRYTVAFRHLGFLATRRFLVLHSGGVDTLIVRMQDVAHLTR